jgi:hypothetical protein
VGVLLVLVIRGVIRGRKYDGSKDNVLHPFQKGNESGHWRENVASAKDGMEERRSECVCIFVNRI